MIVVVDYGMGNSASIVKMVAKVGGEARVTSSPVEVANARKLILPGVGAFDVGMTGLRESGILAALHRRVREEHCPILGICLGVQLFCQRSEEGALQGLGWIDADVRRFAFEPGSPPARVPHMGWNTVTPTEVGRAMFANMEERARFYFVHSYHLVCRNERDIAARTYYGRVFTAAVVRGNIWGVQFHPEKSLRHGMQVMSNFVHGLPSLP